MAKISFKESMSNKSIFDFTKNSDVEQEEE